VDPLSEWLRTYRSEGLILHKADLSGSWGLGLPSSEGIVFHIVRKGTAWLRTADRPPLQLGEGDLVILTGRYPHEIVKSPGSVAEPIANFVSRQIKDPRPAPAETILYCGEFRPDMRSSSGSLRALPPLIHMTPDCLAQTPEVSSLLNLIAAEADRTGAGSPQLAQYLSDALFIYILRACAQHAGHAPGWLPAMQDTYLAKAFALMHAQPHAQWTVGALASAVGLSRAAFARRFTERVGQAPLNYLTAWRMSIASRLLEEKRGSVTQIAEQVGYASQPAFARAFKRHTGVAPASYREKALN
jgi:AraC-like DNA-binding protein